MNHLSIPRFLTAAVLVLLLSACNSTPPKEAWVNLFIKCPTAPDYGQMVDDTAPVWRDSDWTTLATLAPHGIKVQLLTDSPDRRGAYQVQSPAIGEGYIAASLLSDYDPANGVQPDDSTCLE